MAPPGREVEVDHTPSRGSACGLGVPEGDHTPSRGAASGHGVPLQTDHPGRTTGPDHSSEHAHPRLQRRHSEVLRGLHLSTAFTVSPPGDTVPEGAEAEEVRASAHSTPHVISMVGLPARGKTYIGKKLARYLNWIGIRTRVYNLGDYHRRRAAREGAGGRSDREHQFFHPGNTQGRRIRDQVCDEALDEIFTWVEEQGGEVAVLDATNTTVERRALLHRRVVIEKGFKLFFVESICDDVELVESNIKDVKINGLDYVHMGDKEEAMADFKKRIEHYEQQYQTLDEALEPSLSFIKIFNAGRKVSVYQHEGHIQSRIVYFLMNLHIQSRTIYICRHGQSKDNSEGRLGGDSDLTEGGRQYSRRLGRFVTQLQESQDRRLVVWTSWLRRTVQTAQHIRGRQERWKTLNELDSGSCSGLTRDQIRSRLPLEFAARQKDKFTYRYPAGESYEDLVGRLEPVIMELERQETGVLIVGHQAVIRCLLGYLMEEPEDQMTYISVPLHTVIKLTPVAYGCRREDIFLGPGCGVQGAEG